MSFSYQKINNLFFGNMDGSVHISYNRFPFFFKERRIYITCLDSDQNPFANSFLLKRLSDKNIRFEKLHNGILIAENISKLFESKDIFVGYDEIYLLRNDQLISAPKTVFTSESFNFSKKIPSQIIKFFEDNKIDRYLSDGCDGLNFVCSEENAIAYFKSLK